LRLTLLCFGVETVPMEYHDASRHRAVSSLHFLDLPCLVSERRGKRIVSSQPKSDRSGNDETKAQRSNTDGSDFNMPIAANGRFRWIAAPILLRNAKRPRSDSDQAGRNRRNDRAR